MKIGFFEIKNWEKELLKLKLRGHKLYFFKESLNKKNIKKIKNLDIISIFIYSEINKSILDNLPNLKLISTRSTGYDHIDLVACKSKNICVSNVPFYGENTVAEHTFALILSISRRIYHSRIKLLNKNFSINGLMGFDLKGKTLGILGAGHIGLHVIKIAKGFGMNVIAYDRHPDKFLSEVLNFDYVTFPNLLRNSDILSLHVPLTKETYHLISKKEINKMKKGAIVINTSRGEILDTKALLNALNNGKLDGAGIDVIEGEELLKEENQILHKLDSKTRKKLYEEEHLVNHNRVVFTPHIAFYSEEALKRILDTTINNIISFINKKRINCIKNV